VIDMTYSEAYRKGIEILKDAGNDAPANDAGVLLCYAARCDRTYLYAHSGSELPDQIRRLYFELVGKRAGGYPLQYITGEQEFMSLAFEVTHDVLIPRQETELLVETVLDFCREQVLATNDVHGYGQQGRHAGCRQPAEILDMCTGSGCIAVSLAKYLPDCLVTAVDKMPEALAVAERNAERHGVSGRVSFVQSDLFGSVHVKKFDVIVSNPPYVRSEDIGKLQPEVKLFEPAEALDGGSDGLRFYREIIRKAPEYLHAGGMLAFETGYDQAQAVAGLMTSGGSFSEIRVCRDLSGTERVVAGFTSVQAVPL
jgi:release factor glutamine methyltransferase